MLNLLTSQQTRQADAYTVAFNPVSFYELMENAGAAFVQAFTKKFPEKRRPISIYCGTGNNGGDGLVIARLLHDHGYHSLSVKVARFSDRVTDDFEANHTKLLELKVPLLEFYEVLSLEEDTAEIVIDALLGLGLNKPLEGKWKELVEYLHTLSALIVSVDVPAGFPSDGPVLKEATFIKADWVITFQRPKINFLLPESAQAIKQFEVVDIGLDERHIQSAESPYCLLIEGDIRQRLKSRERFSHKGTYGHALIIAGSEETMGAALLCCEASLYTGSGLTTACIPADGLAALNTRLPEVMAVVRNHSRPELKWDKYQSVAIGPGLGTSSGSRKVVEETLKRYKKPIVIDADGINVIAKNYEIMGLVPENSVFTPHVKEFDRLFGDHKCWWERLETGIERATHLGCTIVLKNQYTIIFTRDGKCIFNPSGTPAMATGGTGDVLTGVIASLMAQGYGPEDAAIVGVYVHGKAGRMLEEDENLAVVPAGLLPAKINQVISMLTGDL
ncbi:MAG TPA: NAD(P)H-hydrate dehydratase [Sphingobacteriaceae bacterium]